MKIQSSNVLLTGQNISIQEQIKSESLKFWTGNRRPDFEGSAGRAQFRVLDNIDFSGQLQSAAQDSGKLNRAKSGINDIGKDLQEDPIIKLLRMLLESLTGKNFKITSMAKINKENGNQAAADPGPAINPGQSQPQPSPSSGAAGFGLEYDARTVTTEAESMKFAAQGAVMTTDGKQIEFQLQLTMERVYTNDNSVSIRLGDAVKKQTDPLVINFAGTAAQLTNTKFSFDINSDGKSEQISFVGPNSGFIVLDKNNDGIVNNGSELFGVQSGNGFQDLAAYDKDRNGWIDENDQVFNQLKIWTKDAQGNDSLVGLKAKGIGALYLGSTATPFEIKNGSNDSLGTVRSGGVYLNENGNVGTLQQVDLTL